MQLDIRAPMGLMFAILGLILTIYGLLTGGNTAMYERSLGLNVNLWWGLLSLVFGGIMLFLSRKKK